jgi:hypothetical protein
MSLLRRGEILLAPCNQFCSKKYPSLSIPVSQLWHNLWNPSIAIPQGDGDSNVRFSKKLHQVSLGGAFLRPFVEMTHGVSNKILAMSQE